jgi:uncharacterized protein
MNGVTTSDTAFVDVFTRGPVNMPLRVTNFGELTTVFGGLTRKSRASYGIYQFFLNGGSTAWVVRVASAAAVTAEVDVSSFKLQATGPGTWGNNLQAALQANGLAFDLVVREVRPPSPMQPNPAVVNVEVFRGVTLDPDLPGYVVDVVGHQSLLVSVVDGSVKAPSGPPTAAPVPASRDSIASASNAGNVANTAFVSLAGGLDDVDVPTPDLLGLPGDSGTGTAATGMYTLASIAPAVFNILCLPMLAGFNEDQWTDAYGLAVSFCESQHAFFIADVPDEWDGDNEMAQVKNVQDWFEGTGGGAAVSNSTNYAALYFPRLKIPDPAANSIPMLTENSGTMAGIYARTDAARGVWKAPAGNNATMLGVLQPVVKIGDQDNGVLNEVGINVIRVFPVVGTVSWGARTVQGADLLESAWKYVNIRRLALFLEQSLLQGTTWAVFEPNDEVLWSSLRLSVGSFMNNLYKQGAFAGSSAKDSYFVQCDASTTTASDQALGRVNVSVGFAPLYPAEFVVITISQMSNQ